MEESENYPEEQVDPTSDDMSDQKKDQDAIPSDPLDLVDYRFKHASDKDTLAGKESEAVYKFCSLKFIQLSFKKKTSKLTRI